MKKLIEEELEDCDGYDPWELLDTLEEMIPREDEKKDENAENDDDEKDKNDDIQEKSDAKNKTGLPLLTENTEIQLRNLVEFCDGQESKDDLASTVYLSVVKLGAETPPWAYAWAYHTEAEQTILDFTQSHTQPELDWERFNDLGIGFWLKITMLKQRIYKMAQTTYKKTKDVSKIMLWFLILGKKIYFAGVNESRPKKETSSSVF
eukprot:UN29651